MTQGRPAWQPSYPPQGGAAGGQGYAAAAPSPAYGTPQEQGYQGQDQTHTAGVGQDYPGYQGYQQAYQGYGAQQGQGASAPQWQGQGIGSTPAAPGSRSKQQGEKGFLGSLFDFSFTSFVTPKIVKVLYVLITIWVALIALSILVIGFKTGGIGGGLVVLIIIEPIFILLSLGIYRVILEAFMVVYRIYEETKKIRENGETTS